MDRSKRIFFLLLINLTLAFFSLYILDFLQIIDYRQITQRVPLIGERLQPKIEDPYFLERMELEKKWELLKTRTLNYEQDYRQLKEAQLKLEQDLQALAQEKDNLLSMIENFSNEISNRMTYENKLEEIAIQIENLPPAMAVEVLSKQEDMMIVDIFRKIEERASAAGVQSVIPGITRLMDPELLARVQRLMLQ